MALARVKKDFSFGTLREAIVEVLEKAGIDTATIKDSLTLGRDHMSEIDQLRHEIAALEQRLTSERHRRKAMHVTCESKDIVIGQLRAEVERLTAIVETMAVTADGVRMPQMPGYPVWRTEGPEGVPQRSEYFQSGLAAFRGGVHTEFHQIRDCYSTFAAAEKARTE
jgi:hypothetical protein